MQQYLKAIFGGLSAGLGALATVLVGSSEAFSQITAAQWVTVAVATVAAAGVVWGVPNAPAKAAAKP